MVEIGLGLRLGWLVEIRLWVVEIERGLKIRLWDG